MYGCMNPSPCLQGEVDGQAASTVSVGILEFKSDSVSTLKKRRNVEVVIEAVLAAGSEGLLSNIDGSSVDNSERGPDGDLEAANSEGRRDLTARVSTILLVIGGFFSKSDGGWLPRIVGTTAGLPFGGVVSRDDGDKESKEEDGFH